MAYGIGNYFGHEASFFNSGSSFMDAAAKALAHGVSRAALAYARGQKVSSAFWSGFVASGFAAPKSMGFYKGTAIMATISGTTSELTGGKFANGAVTGAFVHMFNSWADKMAESVAFNRDGKRTFPIFTENMKRFGAELRQGFVNGLKNVNDFSTAAGLAATMSVAEDQTNILAEGAAVFFDGISLLSDTLLIYLGEQSRTSILIDAGVDMISPNGADGKAAGIVLKQYIKTLP